jgi:hypothetical protein
LHKEGFSPTVEFCHCVALFDDFVRSGQNLRRNREADLLRSLQIGHELKFLGCSIGKSAGFAPFGSCLHRMSVTETNQFRCKLRQALLLLVGKSVFDRDILSLNPAKLTQLSPKPFQEAAIIGSSASV